MLPSMMGTPLRVTPRLDMSMEISMSKTEDPGAPLVDREPLAETVQRMNYQYATLGTVAAKDIRRVLGDPRQSTGASTGGKEASEKSGAELKFYRPRHRVTLVTPD